MVLRGNGHFARGFPEAICYTVRAERRCFRRGQLQRAEGAMGTTRGLEVMGCAEALHEERPGTPLVGVAGNHGPTEGPGAVCADRVRVRGRPAYTSE